LNIQAFLGHWRECCAGSHWSRHSREDAKLQRLEHIDTDTKRGEIGRKRPILQQYEALRDFYVDKIPSKDVAARFNYTALGRSRLPM
jgi:hypothetical protein